MSWSANEIAALAAKAARGAGAPAAQADRFGRVAALHLMADRGAAALTAALEKLPGGPVMTYPLSVDRALHDLQQGGAGRLCDVADCGLLSSYVEALPFLASIEAAGSEAVRLRVSLSDARPRVKPRRIVNCSALVDQMTALAQKTFVPESETSRKVGAGAGLTDND